MGAIKTSTIKTGAVTTLLQIEGSQNDANTIALAQIGVVVVKIEYRDEEGGIR